MNNSLAPQNEGVQALESEISLLDIIQFVRSTWKKLAIAALAGAALGLVGWIVLASYAAQYMLINTSNNNISNSTISYALDLVTWKTLQKGLPSLAAQVIEEGKAQEGQIAIMKTFSNEQWWQKNAVPVFALSKADMKDLAAISKDLDLASTTILSLTLTADGASKLAAIDNVRSAANFLRTGGAYLQLRNIINSYESEVISAQSDLQKKITSAEIEMSFQLQRAKNLEDLYKRFPGSSNVNQSVFDPKDSGAKYMSISTQIIAINNDINKSKEDLQRYRDRQDQIAILKSFIEKANPLIHQTFDGLALGRQLLEVEQSVRADLVKDDVKKREVLDNLRANLSLVEARFTRGLEANTAPTTKKTGVVKSAVGGLIGMLFLVFILLLAQRVWASIQVGENSRPIK